jgi:hypothetical protein
MGPKDVIRFTLNTSDFMLNAYLDGLSDADLKIRPVEGMNPIALQLGHLIMAEWFFADTLKPGSAAPLPEGFQAAHDLKNPSGDESRFLTKDEYLKLLQNQRQVILGLLDSFSDADLADTCDGKLPPYAPTVGAMLTMVGLHSINHSSQFIATRRALKLPVAF